MNLKRVSRHFDTEAFEYDGLIPKLIPQYREQNQVIADVIPFPGDAQLQALDLGCGTGILSYLILAAFPRAQVVSFDLAENMLEVCRSNLSGYLDRLTLRQGDFGAGGFGAGYDLVVSGLAIHHLHDQGKKELYKRVYNSLKPGGIFINRDIVLGTTPALSELYLALWSRFIRENGEDEEKWLNTYREEDIPAPLGEQLDWLKEAGFSEVGCHWQYFNFAVFGGRRPL